MEGVSVAELIKHLLVGSIQPYSGKSTIILGMAHQIKEQGLTIAYGGCFTDRSAEAVDEDVRFIGQTLQLPDNCLRPTLLMLSPEMVVNAFRVRTRMTIPASQAVSSG